MGSSNSGKMRSKKLSISIMKTKKSIPTKPPKENPSMFKQIDLKIEVWVQHLVEQIEYVKSH
jgi:hypothetical protein